MLTLAAIATIFSYFWIERPEQKRQAKELVEEQNHWLANGIGKETPFVNTLGMKFVPVPGTKMLFSIWDVRVQDFKTYFRANNNKGEWWDWRNADAFAIGDTHPVVYVTWNDAQDFCKWLTDKERNEGKITQSQSYRLPMDWEWSVAVGLHERRSAAASAKDEKIKGVYPWGNQWPPPNDAGNYDDDASHGIDNFHDGYSHTSPVGSFKANQFGLYDMGGNVYQMCQDELYSGEYVLRGGSWEDGGTRPEALLSSHRGMTPPDDPQNVVGFRCVLVDESYR
jgi:formylglycine-generating enzyme required for sulfatase activity